MELWMYLVVIGMILVSLVGTIWITLWTIQRGEARRTQADTTDASGPPEPPA
ncbi:MAG TPA: hypothetical protein VMM78_03435 [Thermomicrobiales bacterium]|nr:hypothetical protein [Thermomicrobiales bacterium]